MIKVRYIIINRIRKSDMKYGRAQGGFRKDDVLEWGADKPVIGGFFTWCLKKGHSGGKKLAATAGNRGLFIALLLFVGIPIPGTGAWSGILAASILDWNFKQSVVAVMLGVILAGLIMGTLTILGLGAFS